MATVNVNNIIIYMINNEKSLEEALKQFNLNEQDLSDDTIEAINQGIQNHRESLSEEEQQKEAEQRAAMERSRTTQIFDTVEPAVPNENNR